MIRGMLPADAQALEQILASSPGASPWTARDLLHLSKSGAQIWVADEAGRVAGMVAAQTVADEAEILNLAVDRTSRRHGVGRRLMLTAITAAAQAGARQVFLEVRESNLGARAFYAALGFAETGRRRAYYRDPAEDALVMSRTAKSDREFAI